METVVYFDRCVKNGRRQAVADGRLHDPVGTIPTIDQLATAVERGGS